MRRLDGAASAAAFDWTNFSDSRDLVAAVDRLALEDPERSAVVVPGGRASYAELASLGRSLARRIGTGGTAPVLALGQPGIMLVAAIIACLRVGRPLVSIDPATSPLRLQQVAMLSGADVLVRHCDDAPTIAGLRDDRIRTILFDKIGPGDTGQPAAPVPAETAFIVFTSGSTGVPKGAPHTPRSLAEAVALQIAILDIRPGDRMTLVAPAGTIGALTFTMIPLAIGATLLLLPERVPVAELLELMERERATHLLSFIGLARAACGHPRVAAAFRGLRALQTYGDIIRDDDCAMLRGALPAGADIHLLYGSTEANLVAGCIAGPDAAAAQGRLPLGRPLPGMEVWLRPDPSGDPDVGEIWVAGGRVTRGYWRDARAGEGRFLAHPDDPGRIMFGTGDLARVRPDGLLDYAGRTDNQVKLRGWRIELEDIETAARRVPGVSAAGVVPRRDGSGTVEALALHVAANDADATVPTAIDAALRETLPGYMVPAQVLVHGALPLTATGKIDRLRLAEIDRQRRDEALGADRAGASSLADWPDPLAARIAAVIAREAGVAALGPDDDLDARGTDSLQAINIALRIEKQWGVAIDPAELLDGRPLGAIVATIASRAREA